MWTEEPTTAHSAMTDETIKEYAEAAYVARRLIAD